MTFTFDWRELDVKFFYVAKIPGEILQKKKKKKKKKIQEPKLGADTRECELFLRTYVLSCPFRSEIWYINRVYG